MPCLMARLLRPAGWRGRTVANGNIKVRLKEGPTMDRRDSQPAFPELRARRWRDFSAVIPCCNTIRGCAMPRMTDDEKLAALEKRKAEIQTAQLRSTASCAPSSPGKKARAEATTRTARSSPGPWRSNTLPKIPAPNSARSCSACSINTPARRIAGCSCFSPAPEPPCRNSRGRRIVGNRPAASRPCLARGALPLSRSPRSISTRKLPQAFWDLRGADSRL